MSTFLFPGNALSFACCLCLHHLMTNWLFTELCPWATLLCAENLLQLLISFWLTNLLHVQICCLCTIILNWWKGKGKAIHALIFISHRLKMNPKCVLKVTYSILDFIFLRLRKQNKEWGVQENALVVFGISASNKWKCLFICSFLFFTLKLEIEGGTRLLLLFVLIYSYLYSV